MSFRWYHNRIASLCFFRRSSENVRPLSGDGFPLAAALIFCLVISECGFLAYGARCLPVCAALIFCLVSSDGIRPGLPLFQAGLPCLERLMLCLRSSVKTTPVLLWRNFSRVSLETIRPVIRFFAASPIRRFPPVGSYQTSDYFYQAYLPFGGPPW